MAYEEFTWLKYYENLYHAQKKKNNMLAMQIGEATAKNDELSFAYNRVVNSSIWRAMAPVRKIYSAVKGGEKTSDKPLDKTEPDQETEAFYHKRLEMYEDFYGQWIRKNEKECIYSSKKQEASGCSDEFCTFIIEDCVKAEAPWSVQSDAEWLLFVGKEGHVANCMYERLHNALSGRDKVLIGYADEDYYYTYSDGDNISERRLEPNFKPDWSPDTLDSFFYFGHVMLIRTSFATTLTWLGSEDGYKNLYDLALQASECVGKHFDDEGVLHISEVLYHNCVDKYKLSDDNGSYETWVKISRAVKDDLSVGKLCIGHTAEFDDIKQESLKRRGLKAELIEGQWPDTHQIAYECPMDKRISVLIPTKDHPEVLNKCISSFTEGTDYPDIKNKVEFIVVDNGSSEENRAAYETLLDEKLCGYAYWYIYKPMEFNFSAMCNLAAASATGDIFLFLNDDTEIVQKDWLRLMTGYASLEHVGSVGAKLLYAGTDLIQHAGVTSLSIGPSHKLVMYPDDVMHYFGRNIFGYDMLGVTGACLMVDKNKFNHVGGFDEDFAVAYNDVDLCMKLSKSGFVNLQCNGALLYHYESMTRGLDEMDEAKWDRLLHE